MSESSSAEWNSGVYHQVSSPQVTWGVSILDGLELRGDEIVLDAGCGTGRVTAELLGRLPEGRAIAVDRSENMLAGAREHLAPLFGDRVRYLQADLTAIRPSDAGEPVDRVFSTATFHWIRDHAALFRSLFALLKPGGRLVAQCGGGPNLQRHVERAETLMQSDAYRAFFAGWTPPSFSVGRDRAEKHLRRAGFVDVETAPFPAPGMLHDFETFHPYMTDVVFREHLLRIPDKALRVGFIDDLTPLAACDDPPYSLDYWRLNMRGRRPLTGEPRAPAEDIRRNS